MITAILLAGGQGIRMGKTVPKQFLTLGGIPIARYGFDVLCGHSLIDEVIVVCPAEYQAIFDHPKASFARPGPRRQDSVFSGLQASSPHTEYLCIHDAARPFINQSLVSEVISAAKEVGAAAAAVPLKFTIKEVNSSGFVTGTPDRSRFYEVQTPQTVRKELLIEGFATAKKRSLTVTDDVSLVEILEHPVKLVPGSHMNIKITTTEDLSLAESYVLAN